MTRRQLITLALAGTATIASAALATAPMVSAAATVNHNAATTTPIKHVVVIFQENVSFDHYFGTYPNATNTSGQPFVPPAHVQKVTNLLTNTPNTDAGGNQVNPRRLNPANINDVLTCDQGHNYNAEQKAFDGGLM